MKMKDHVNHVTEKSEIIFFLIFFFWIFSPQYQNDANFTQLGFDSSILKMNHQFPKKTMLQ